MKVFLSEHSGACYGVQRALDLALNTVGDGQPACTLGPLIHNPQVVDQLAREGVSTARGVEDVAPNATVIIRSHGVTPEVMSAVTAKAARVVDATCPYVARAQAGAGALAARGGSVVVVGEAGHPEVEGLVARARVAAPHVHVVARPTDLPERLAEPVGIVVQTTQTAEALASIVDALAARGITPVVKNTICKATRQRQDAAAALARRVDAIVVIGGRNSSNTTRLASICKEACPRTHHIESPDEIDPAWFTGCESVGVTAGASTPEAQIKAVIERLERL